MGFGLFVEGHFRLQSRANECLTKRWSERLAASFPHVYEIPLSTRSDALSRQPSLILFSLDAIRRVARVSSMVPCVQAANGSTISEQLGIGTCEATLRCDDSFTGVPRGSRVYWALWGYLAHCGRARALRVGSRTIALLIVRRSRTGSGRAAKRCIARPATTYFRVRIQIDHCRSLLQLSRCHANASNHQWSERPPAGVHVSTCLDAFTPSDARSRARVAHLFSLDASHDRRDSAQEDIRFRLVFRRMRVGAR